MFEILTENIFLGQFSVLFVTKFIFMIATANAICL